MQALGEILSALSSAVGAASGTISIATWLVGYLRNKARSRRTDEVLQFLKDLGCYSDAHVQELVKIWDAPPTVTDAARAELAQLLVNLTHGARFHTTQGTPLSSYLRSERLIEQLLANLQPKRRVGESVGPGRTDWTLSRFLGMGAFGEVWLGRSRRHPEPRAFKFCTLPEARDWLDREGQVLYEVQRQLADCPNVIRYIDVALDGTPFPYLVLEYVAGGSLEDWVLAAPAERPAINVTELLTGIARGLAAAHRHGIFHRDLKPANVLLTTGTDPDPKIADFGLSRVEAERGEESTASQSRAVVVGTRLYLPPEAADVYATRAPAQDDIFALGVIWYQLLTGRIERPPYDFADHLLKDGTESRTVRLLSRCLAQPSRRFADAGELLSALEQDVGPTEWDVPDGCFDIAPLAREYLDSLTR